MLFNSLLTAKLDETGMMLETGVRLPVVGKADGDGTIFVRQAHKDVWQLVQDHVVGGGNGVEGVIILGPVGVGKVRIVADRVDDFVGITGSKLNCCRVCCRVGSLGTASLWHCK